MFLQIQTRIMNVPVLQLVNFIIILVAMIFLIKYLWEIFFEENYAPPAWEFARKQGTISDELLKVSKNYPDKIRLYNIWLQIQRIDETNVPGAFAELGVYKGESARLIHLMSAGRDLYLFDTFQGMPAIDLEPETGEASTYSAENFADTSIPEVLKYIGGDPDKLKVYAGYFPQSISGLNVNAFALVNIDADLFNPVKAGLEYFYPLLSPGGVILVHDYNHKWNGLMKAVNEFAATIPETPVLIPDVDSTVMIVKNKLQPAQTTCIS
jgi:O-methyltransferase